MALSFKDHFDYGFSGRLGPPTPREENVVYGPIREKRMLDLAQLNLRAQLLVGFLSLALIILIAGIIGVGLINNINHHSLDVGVNQAPLGDSAMEIKLTATTAHLWFYGNRVSHKLSAI